MENFEKEYFITKETELWHKLNISTELLGKMDISTMLIRTEWATYYRICKRFFSEYRNSKTLDS